MNEISPDTIKAFEKSSLTMTCLMEGETLAFVLHEWLLQLPLILPRLAAVVEGLGFSL